LTSTNPAKWQKFSSNLAVHPFIQFSSSDMIYGHFAILWPVASFWISDTKLIINFIPGCVEHIWSSTS
jgi:hypothetical protein